MRYCFVTIYRRNYERRFWKISYIHFRACRGRIACRRYDCGRGVLRGGGGFRGEAGNGGGGRGRRDFETPDLSLGGGVRYVAADDLVFVDQQRRVHRLGSAGVVVDFVDVAHDLFPGVLPQVIPLALLQGVVALEYVAGRRGDTYLTGICGGRGDVPAEIRQKFHPAVVAGSRGRGSLGGIPPPAHQPNQRPDQRGPAGKGDQ